MLTELVAVPGGSFRMGSTAFYPEEAPTHTVTVGVFAIEQHPVTNAQFAAFVAATGYVTIAERPLNPALYPGVAEADLLPEHFCLVGIVREPMPVDDLRQRLMESRLERYIGVIYRPETERWSHYSEARLPLQFDAYAWFDRTQAVTPLGREHASTDEHEHDAPSAAEMYPFGV